MVEAHRAWILGATDLRFAERPRGVPGPGQVEIRLVAAGICRTDVAVARGERSVERPRVLGHEGAGWVVAAGPGAEAWLGAAVAVDPRTSEHGLAMMGVETDGLFAERFLAPASRLYPVAGLPWRRAAYLEPVAASLAVAEVGLLPNETFALTGDGRIAELTRRILRRAGLEREVGEQADVVIETGGTQASFQAALLAVRPGGRVLLKARPARLPSVVLHRVVEDRLRLEGLTYGRFQTALEWLRDLPLDDLFGAVRPLHAFEDALMDSEQAKRFLAPDPEEALGCAG